MSTAINWSVPPGDPVLQHPLYQRYASSTIGSLDATSVKQTLQGALADNESAAVIAYLSWLLRVLQLVA